VISGRDPAEGVRRWQRAQQEVVGSSIASGAAAAGYVLAQLRKKHGRTMQQVADAIGMTLSVYHRMEMASRMIQSEEIDKVAEFYGMTPEALIGLFEQRTAGRWSATRCSAASATPVHRRPSRRSCRFAGE
jgi:hypothetical protein